MSYILEALRKADAERERDPARGIHAQPATLDAGLHRKRGVPWWFWASGGALVLGIGAFVALRGGGEVPRPVVTPGPVAPPVVVMPAPAPAPVAATVVQPAPPPMLAPAPAPAPVATPRMAAPVAKAAASAPAVPAASAASSVPDRIFTVAELPPDVQRDLPKLAITGGVHSESASQRMLIVGGQVVAEGVELAPGVVLEQIRPKTAVLRFRGIRYSVPY